MNLVDALSWNKPIVNRRSINTKCDVSVSYSCCHGKYSDYARFTFTFRNDTWQLVAPNSGKVTYAVGFGIVAFKESDEGWSFSWDSNKTAMRLQVTVRDEKLVASLKKMIGDYDLQEDSGVYYIQKEVKHE